MGKVHAVTQSDHCLCGLRNCVIFIMTVAIINTITVIMWLPTNVELYSMFMFTLELKPLKPHVHLRMMV